MPTTVHIPDELLARIDERARQLQVSRNRYIVRALEARLGQETEWSPDLAEFLAAGNDDPELGEAVDEMLHAIEERRASKPRLKL
jgi:predicted transcriptional regulator